MGDGSETLTGGRRDGHLTVYLVWPVLSGVVLALVGVVSVGGVVLLASGDLRKAAKVAGYVGFAGLGLVTVLVFLYVLAEWRGPAQRERMEHLRHEDGCIEVEPEELGLAEDMTRWPVLRPYGERARQALLPAPETAVRSIFPPVDVQTQALYAFITRVWPTGNVSRDHCIELGFGRAQWERYVGGQRGKEGLESGRGILERAGLVYKDKKRHWQITPGAGLAEAYRVTEALEAYAHSMASLVRVGQDGQDRTGQGGERVPVSGLNRGGEG